MMETTKQDRYHFKDFTQKNYRKLLELAIKTRKFVNYDDVTEAHGNEVWWRHDVDFSLERSLELAKIENEYGLSTTYFFLLHSENYNILGEESRSIVKQIIQLGHKIGLHFDTSYYGICDINILEKYLRLESATLHDYFNVEVKVFSFHNPNKFALSCKEYIYADMINTYAAKFQNEVNYCSDSNGYWRHKRLEDVLNDKNLGQLQVLTHPVWWTENIMSPRKRIETSLERNLKNRLKKYDKDLYLTGRLNAD